MLFDVWDADRWELMLVVDYPDLASAIAGAQGLATNPRFMLRNLFVCAAEHPTNVRHGDPTNARRDDVRRLSEALNFYGRGALATLH